jgi:hypothetical protein
LERLGLDANGIGDKGGMVLLNVLQHYNYTLTSLNLNNNSTISLVLQKQIDFMLTSRLVLKSFCNCCLRPLEKRLVPLVIHAVRQSFFYGEKLEPTHCQETGAGPIFLLVRAAASSLERP